MNRPRITAYGLHKSWNKAHFTLLARKVRIPSSITAIAESLGIFGDFENPNSSCQKLPRKVLKCPLFGLFSLIWNTSIPIHNILNIGIL
jgi:hypothetical protein